MNCLFTKKKILLRRTESKRIYKTLLRSCLKHKPTDNIKNFFEPNKHEHLFRSQSTPSLRRFWICLSCGLANNSVTWHCLNCECVSFLAPIYKETLKRNAVDLTIDQEQSSAIGNVAQSKSSSKLRHFSMDSGGPQQRKCQLCSYKSNASNESTICRHQTRTKYLRFPMIGATRIGPEQKSFDEGRYYANDGLYYSNRKINKSLSSITDSFGGNVFGERIFTKNHRPTTLVVNENTTRRTTSKGTVESYSRQLSVPNTTSELSQFNDFSSSTTTTPEQRASNTIQTSISCDICGVCNQNRCQAVSANCDSRFTVTTLSRSGTLTLGNKFQTLPRNGGVFIAVKDWSNLPSSSSGYGGPQVATMQDNYYEILKNPNNNQPYENHSIIAKEKEQTEPIYAVVNKSNKTKNKLQQQQSEPKFSYVGTQQIAGVGNKSDSALYASIAAVNNNRLPSLDNNGSNCNIKTSHITITSSNDDHQAGSDTSEIYAKVWKGPRKTLDSQKMYVVVLHCCLILLTNFVFCYIRHWLLLDSFFFVIYLHCRPCGDRRSELFFHQKTLTRISSDQI